MFIIKERLEYPSALPMVRPCVRMHTHNLYRRRLRSVALHPPPPRVYNR